MIESKFQIQLISGELFDLLDPDPALLNADEILVPLSSLFRWCGRTSVPWTVLDHSYLCVVAANKSGWDITQPGLLRALALHDAHEAFISDIPSPVKALLGLRLKELEARLDACISARFNTDLLLFRDEIKQFDETALVAEAELLLPNQPRASWIEPIRDKLDPSLIALMRNLIMPIKDMKGRGIHLRGIIDENLSDKNVSIN